jgi:hypothetical protein
MAAAQIRASVRLQVVLPLSFKTIQANNSTKMNDSLLFLL